MTSGIKACPTNAASQSGGLPFALPEGWQARRLKHVASVRVSNVDKKSVEGEQPVRLCNYVDVYKNDFITPAIEFMEATATAAQVARFTLSAGDVLITKDSEEWTDIAVPAYVKTDLPGVLCGYHLAHLRPTPGIMDGRYLFRAIGSEGIADQFRVAANGITRFGLSIDDLSNPLMPVPPLKVQQAIAAFLDRETAQIDNVIAKKQRMIRLLGAKRQAVVSHAVTEGLDSNAPQREAGITGLRHVPAHWEVKRLRFLTPRVSVGIVVTPAKYYEEEGVPALRSLNVKEGRLVANDLVFISPESNSLHGKSMIFEGDLVAVRTGQPGTTAVVDARFHGANCIDLIIIRQSSKFDSRFLCFLMNSAFVKAQFAAGSDGAIQQHFNIETATDLLVPVPPIEEQRQIASTLLVETGRLTSLARANEQQIAKLREYRQALISAAVTGKLPVPVEAAA